MAREDSRNYTDRTLTNVDDKRRVLQLGEMNIVPPPVGIFDAPVRCYPVNEQWASIVMGIVSWLAHPAVWRDATDLDYFAISEINRFKVGQECGIMLQVRQNPLEPCILEYSINGGDDWVSFADILQCITQDFIENSMITGFGTNQNLIDIISDIADTGSENNIPPQPTASEPDLLCDAAFYIVDKIIDFIDETITDAATITLDEFLTALLGLGGFEASLLVLFWDLIVANSYPDLLTDVQAARSEVAGYLYCNELDKDLTTLDIDASVTISDPAQAAFIAAMNAITDGKYSLWAFVGSQIDSGETCLCSWEFTCDFTVENCDFYAYALPAPYDELIGEYVASTGWDTTDVREGASQWARSTNPAIDFPDTHIDTIQFTFNFQEGFWGQVSQVAIGIFGYLNGSLVYTATQSRQATADGNGLTYGASPNQTFDTIRLIVRPSTSVVGKSQLTGSALVTDIIITGTGTNPFV